MALNTGYCYINSDFKLRFEDSLYSIQFKNQITIVPGNTVIGFSLGEMERTFTLINTRFSTLADIESFLDKIKDLQVTGSPYTLLWQVVSDGTYFKWDGDSTTMYVLCESIFNLQKEAKADQTIYKIQRITFKEASR